jgi:opacity protein-like surface antigen
MKKLLLASVIAIASAAAMIAPANAGGRVTIGIGGGYADDYYRNDCYAFGDCYGDRYVYRPYYQDDPYDNGYMPRYFHRHHHRCHIKYIKHWRHHHKVVEVVRVCRY